MGVEDLYASNSNWLKAEDLRGKEVELTIGKVSLEEINKQHKILIEFAGKEKGLLLNKTNATVIAKMYGDDYVTWIEKNVILYPTVTDYDGKTVDCIRVRIPLETASNEEIPF